MWFGPPPQMLQAEVFSRLPDTLRSDPVGRKGTFLEGPSFDRGGNLLCVDIRASRIYRVTPAGQWSVVTEYDGIPNGLKIHRDGRLFVADRKRGLLIVDPHSGSIETLLAGPRNGERFRGLNDLIFAANGDLYFTDQGRSGLQDPTGKVYRLDAQGTLECLIGNVPSPNGLVLNQRETALYIAVTRANSVWRLELDDAEHRTGLFVQLGSPGPDGMALDSDGNVVVAHPTFGAVWLFGKRGEPLFCIRPPQGHMPTNMAYGGADMRMLFITESQSCTLLSVRLPVAGKRMFSHT